MNRKQRRNMPVEENHRVTVSIVENTARLTMIGMTSRVATHVHLTSALSFKLGWSLIKTAWKTWRK
jgi:hypothetical protein